MRRAAALAAALVFAGFGAHCVGPRESPRVILPLSTATMNGEAATNDLGYDVTLTSCRLALRDLTFTAREETVARAQPMRAFFAPRALAHPGHFSNGEVIGELRGRFLADFGAGATSLGDATLLEGNYGAADFVFDRADEDSVELSDPLYGHTAYLVGVARRDGAETLFTVALDAPEERALIGVPFDAQVDERTAGALSMRFVITDPFEGDTLFDGVDFAALDADDDGLVELSDGDEATANAYNLIRRTFLTHDHYFVSLLE